MADNEMDEVKKNITEVLNHVTTWFGQQAKAASILSLVTRGLTDLNRLADAAEKIATPLILSESVEHTVASALEGSDKVAAYITAEERETLYALRNGTAKVISAPGASMPAAPPTDSADAITASKGAVLDFVGFLTTRDGVAKFGAAYEVPVALAVAQEYFAKKGW